MDRRPSTSSGRTNAGETPTLPEYAYQTDTVSEVYSLWSIGRTGHYTTNKCRRPRCAGVVM